MTDVEVVQTIDLKKPKKLKKKEKSRDIDIAELESEIVQPGQEQPKDEQGLGFYSKSGSISLDFYCVFYNKKE
jgi:hypothetical protein